MLRDNGYTNGTFGKWHINEDPLQHGFHENVGGSQKGKDCEGSETLDGIDLSPLFAQQEMAKRSLKWHFPIYLEGYNPKEDGGRDPLFRTRP